jgi:hypothetical protein
MPQTRADYGQISSIRKQSALVKTFAHRSGQKVPDFIFGVTTYRKAIFTQSPSFDRAVALAQELGEAVWVADIWELLRKTRPEDVNAALLKLDELKVDVFDCVHARRWRDFTATDRLAFLQQTMARKIESAAASGHVRNAKTPDPRNGLRGASANRKKADQRAESLRQIVKAFRSELPAGSLLTPSMLMRHLNDIGHKPERAKAWSLNSCKNLLQRLLSDDE